MTAVSFKTQGGVGACAAVVLMLPLRKFPEFLCMSIDWLCCIQTCVMAVHHCEGIAQHNEVLINRGNTSSARTHQISHA